MKGVNDSDARGALAKGRAESAEARIGRKSGVIGKEAERLARKIEDMPRPEKSSHLRVDGVDAGRLLAEFDIGKEMWWKHRFEDEDKPSVWRLGGTDRVWVRGENGCGKSTLLRELLRQLRVPSNRVIWIEQEPKRERSFEQAKAHGADARTKMLHAAAALGLDVEIFLNDLPASPGQLRKLALAEGLVRDPMVIVLDEPTNDLDIPGIERLEDALQDFGGSLVIVTHDVYFAKKLGLVPLDTLF